MNFMFKSAISFVILVSTIPLSFSESNFPTCETKEMLIVVTDKIHYSVGDAILILGCLSDDIKNEDLRLSVTGYEGKLYEKEKTFLFTFIKPNPDGTFSYEISSQILSENGPYWISASAGFQEKNVKVYLSRFGDLCGTVSNENPIMIFTDKENYERVDKINVFGCLGEVAFTKGINIHLYDEDGNLVSHHTFAPDSDATYSTIFEINDSFVKDGKYTVEVDAAGSYQTNKTIVVPEFGTVVMVVLALGFFVTLVTSQKFFGLKKN